MLVKTITTGPSACKRICDLRPLGDASRDQSLHGKSTDFVPSLGVRRLEALLRIENLISQQAPPAAIAFSLTENGDKVTLIAHKWRSPGFGISGPSRPDYCNAGRGRLLEWLGAANATPTPSGSEGCKAEALAIVFKLG